MSNIAKAVRILSGANEASKVRYVVCDVISVNESERTCDVTTVSDSGELEMKDVALMAESDDGNLCLPAIGSTVIVSFSDVIAPFVVQWSEIQKWLMIIGNSGIEMTADKIKLNDGSYGGLVKVVELTQKYNDLVTLVNSFITMYNSHTHASNGTPTTALQTNTAQSITREDIENTTTTHGGSI